MAQSPSADSQGGDIVGLRAELAQQMLDPDPDVPLVELFDMACRSALASVGARSMYRTEGSVRTTIMAEAVNESDIDAENPEKVTQYYLKNKGIVILDLDANLSER